MRYLKTLTVLAFVSAVQLELLAGYVPTDAEWNNWTTITESTGTLGGGNYKVISSVERAQLAISDGATVTIWFKGLNANLTCTGDLSQAGILLPSNSTLIVRSADAYMHKVTAIGGSASNGKRGEDGTKKVGTKKGSGGRGGDGGMGAGPGIGGNGGAGGSGGSGGVNKDADAHGGGNGKAGNSCGALFVHHYVEVSATGGAASKGGAGGEEGGESYCGAGGGGGGGGGGAPGIGTGGVGGGGGGGGGGGAAGGAGTPGHGGDGHPNKGSEGKGDPDDHGGKPGSGGSYDHNFRPSGNAYSWDKSAIKVNDSESSISASFGGGVVWLDVNLPIGVSPDSNHYDDCVICEGSGNSLTVPGFSVVVPSANRLGRKFNGYWTAASGGYQMYQANGKRISNSVTLANNAKLYAQWSDALPSGISVTGSGWSYVDRVLTLPAGTFTITGSAAVTNDFQIKMAANGISLTIKDLHLRSTGGATMFFAPGVTSGTLLVEGSSSFVSLASGKPGIDLAGVSLGISSASGLVNNPRLSVWGGSGASAIGLGQGVAGTTECGLGVSSVRLEAHGGGNGAFDIGIGSENAATVATKIEVCGSTIVADKIGGGGGASYVKVGSGSLISSQGDVPTVVPSPVDFGIPAFPVVLTAAAGDTAVKLNLQRIDVDSLEKLTCYSVKGKICLWLVNSAYRVYNTTIGIDQLVGVANGLVASWPNQVSMTVNGVSVDSTPPKGAGWSYDGAKLILDDSAKTFTLSGVLKCNLIVSNAAAVVLSDAAVVFAGCNVFSSTKFQLAGSNLIAAKDIEGMTIAAGVDLSVNRVQTSAGDSAALMLLSGPVRAVANDNDTGLHRLTIAGGRIITGPMLYARSGVADIGHLATDDGVAGRQLELVMKGGSLEADSIRVNPLTVQGGSFNVANVYTPPSKATFATKAAAVQLASQLVVERPTEVAEANVGAEDYANLFEVKAVQSASAPSSESGGTEPVWTLQSALKEDVKAEVQEAIEEAQASLKESLSSETPSATVKTKAGLYYGIAGASDLGELDSAEPKSWTLGDGTAKEVTGEKPAADRGFYRVIVKP